MSQLKQEPLVQAGGCEPLCPFGNILKQIKNSPHTSVDNQFIETRHLNFSFSSAI